jgi:transposase
MSAAYSLDLREKAVAAYERGQRKTDVCRTFNISRNTLDLWLKRREQVGTLEPKVYRRGPNPKIQDLEKFEAFVIENGDMTQEELAQKWSEVEEPVTRKLISHALKKIEYTRKKKFSLPRKK